MAIFLFGVVMVALTGVFIAATRSIGDQRLRTSATRVATDRLETLRSLPFDQLDAQAGSTIATTADGRAFPIVTDVTPIDAVTGLAGPGGRVRRITVVVTWRSRGAERTVSYTTAVAPDEARAAAPAQAIGTISMFPSPAVSDASGRPQEDIQVTVPLVGFPVTTLGHLSWSNADGTAGTTTLTNTAEVNWRGTVAANQLRAAIGATGTGEVEFTVSAGSLASLYTLSLRVAAANPPAITGATIDRSPVAVARPTAGQTCADPNQCQNTTDVTFTATSTGLDPAQDSVILHYQLSDGTFQEVPLTPVGQQWRFTSRQKTTKFLPGTGRAFRFSAIRSADGATAATTVQRDVVST